MYLQVNINIRNKETILVVCLRISINGPVVSDFPYQESLELLFEKPQNIHCSDKTCTLCGGHEEK